MSRLTDQGSAGQRVVRHSTGAERGAHAIGEILRLIDEIEAQQTTVAGAVEEQMATAGEISSGVFAVAEGAAVSAHAVEELRRAADFVSEKSRQLDGLFAG